MIKKNNLTKIIFTATLALMVFIPVFSNAQGGSTGGSGSNTGVVYECNNAKPGDCTYGDLIKAVVKAVNWMIIFTLEFSVVVIAYAGFNYMISGDNPGKRTEANTMLRKVALGIFFVLAAWLIVNLIAKALLNQAVLNVAPPIMP